MAQRDPFYAVKDKVITTVQTVENEFNTINNTNNAINQNLLNNIKSHIHDIEIDTNDLAQTITIVQSNRHKFTQITDNELQSRISFVNATQQQIKQFKSQYDVLSQKAQSQKKSLLTRNNDNTRPNNNNSNNPVNNLQQQQLQIEVNQDEVLDDMSVALDRLQNLAGDINTELNTQKVMLDELDTELDDASGTMKRTIKRLDKLLATSDKGRLGCIVVMFLIAILLLFLVIYT